MPPKGSAKAKVADKAPATPSKSTTKTKAKPETPSSAKPTSKVPPTTPRRKKNAEGGSTVCAFNMLSKPEGMTLPIDVQYDQSAQAALRKKGGGFEKILRLDSGGAFTVIKTIMITEGPDSGHQAIILSPAKPFEFLNLSVEARNRIYGHYFDITRGADKLVLDGKRSSNKEIFAKTYSEGSRNRVALLAVSKMVHQEAAPIFYGLTIKFENTSSVTDFLSQTPTSLLSKLTSIEIKLYQKTSARNAMHLLSGCPNIRHLRIDQGVFAERDVKKAARAIWADMYKLLPALGATRSPKSSAVDVLSFGRDALTHKAGDSGDDSDGAASEGKSRPWSKAHRAELIADLKGRVVSQSFRAWTCVCGCVVDGHSCGTVLRARERERKKRREMDEGVHLAHGGAAMLAALETMVADVEEEPGATLADFVPAG